MVDGRLLLGPDGQVAETVITVRATRMDVL